MLNIRVNEAEERINELKDKAVELIQSEHQKEKNEKTEDSLRDLWGNIKWTNICIIVVPEGEERKAQRLYLKK